MSKFAYFAYPKSLAQIREIWPQTRFIPFFLIKYYLKKVPLKICNLGLLKTFKGKSVEGFLIILPVLKNDLLKFTEEEIFEKIIDASRLAEENKALIMGLDGLLALAADRKPFIYKHLKRTALTSGSCLMAWNIFEGLFQTLKAKNIDLKNASVTIIDAGSAVGWLLTRKFAEMDCKVKLVNCVKESFQKIDSFGNKRIEIDLDCSTAVNNADIIINCSRKPDVKLGFLNIKENAIVIDISLFDHFKKVNSSDNKFDLIGMQFLKLPNKFLIPYFGIADNLVSASVAESMLLAIEEKFINYSLGESLNLAKIEEIGNFAKENGFKSYTQTN